MHAHMHTEYVHFNCILILMQFYFLNLFGGQDIIVLPRLTSGSWIRVIFLP